MIFTTKMTKEDLKHAMDLEYAPCMFQEYVPKKNEFRVTVIGDTLHTAEIHSQKKEKTMHDWRRDDDFKNTPYIKAKLPNYVTSKLLKFMELMGLEFGAIDLIQTPSDDIVFLEVNSGGRWWWIQELTGMNIAKDIAHYLAIDK
jgi:glutathione synthase/RimK-type ligase-like ATP-grasp enzyme